MQLRGSTEFEYELTEADIVEGALAVAYGSRTRRTISAATLLAGSALLWSTMMMGGSAAYGLLPASLAFASIVLFQRLVVPRIQRDQLGASLREGRNLYLRGKQRMVLDSDGIAVGNWAMETRLRWAAIERVEKTAHVVLLYYGGGRALMIPRRAFGTDLAADLAIDDFMGMAQQLGQSALRQLAASQAPRRDG